MNEMVFLKQYSAYYTKRTLCPVQVPTRKGLCDLVNTCKKQALTRIARNTVEPIPSATSYSPFSLGRVKLCSLPDPNIL